jgi:hypothetical protein
MKNIVIVAILIFTFLSCDKTDVNFQKDIQGTWRLKTIYGTEAGITLTTWDDKHWDEIKFDGNKYIFISQGKTVSSGKIFIDEIKFSKQINFQEKSNSDLNAKQLVDKFSIKKISDEIMISQTGTYDGLNWTLKKV